MQEQFEESDIESRSEGAEAADRVESLIEETEDAIRNTRSFLEHLRATEQEACQMVDMMTKRLEKELRHLQRRGRADAF